MRKRITLFCLAFAYISAFGQPKTDIDLDNIVPNSSFEKYSAAPIGWFYKGDHYSRVMKYWTAPTNASPDVFGPRVRVPRQWKEKGFGAQKARTGVSMTGLTLYGCENGKPHCREYIQIELAEPLVPNQEYYAEFWVSHLPLSLRINNIGMHFAMKKIKMPTADLLDKQASIKAEDIILSPTNQWTKIAGSFKAKEASNYLIIGNFSEDASTTLAPPVPNSLPYAYYYIDDVKVVKKLPIIDVPIEDGDLCCIKVKKGETVQLKNIFFNTNESELLPRSYVELKKLLALMERNPKLKIQIMGHTDNIGDDAYNLSLSTQRAAAVVQYLNQNGITPNRTTYKGFGSKKAIADNSTEAGRQKNRRVEFMVLDN